MILTVTFNPAIDHTYTLEEDIEAGAISRTQKSRFDAGGKGINVSTYLKSLGNETLATGPLGGFTGDFIKSELESQGLNHDFVEGGMTRINTTITTEEEEYKINHSGSELDQEVVEKIVDKVKDENPEAVVISGSLPPGLDYTAVESIKNNVNSKVIVDLSGDVLGRLKGDYFLAKPNREELSGATGLKVKSVEDGVKAAEKLLEKGFKHVLASLGEDGALLATEEEKIYVEGLEANVVDTTGAGDAMLAAILSELMKGRGKEKSLITGLAFATLVVETPGTQVPELDKLEDYREKVKVKEIS